MTETTTFHERLDKELRNIEMLRSLRGEDPATDIDVRQQIKAAKANVEAMALAKHLEDAVVSAIRVTTEDQWRAEGERWERWKQSTWHVWFNASKNPSELSLRYEDG